MYEICLKGIGKNGGCESVEEEITYIRTLLYA